MCPRSGTELRFMMRKLARAIAGMVLTLLIGGVLAAVLVRHAPGFGADEVLLDGRMSAEAIREIQDSAKRESAFGFYWRYLRGEMGVSQAYHLPVTELLQQRMRPTLTYAAAGLLMGWAAAVALALMVTLAGERRTGLARIAASTFLCLPSAALALILLLVFRPVERGHAVAAAAAVAIFARVLLAASAVFGGTRRELFPLAARARGVGPTRIAALHMMWPSLPAVLNLLVVYIPVTFGLAVALETFFDVPGLGQLAWLAAQQRDLPVLVSLSMMVLGITTVCGSLSRLLAPSPASVVRSSV